MESLRNNATAIVVELESLGFVPGGGDNDECRVLVRRNTAGHADLRACLVFANETTLNNISVHGFDGSAGEIIDWHMEITGGTPLTAFLAFMRSVCAGGGVNFG
jgi:hypothetical protein